MFVVFISDFVYKLLLVLINLTLALYVNVRGKFVTKFFSVELSPTTSWYGNLNFVILRYMLFCYFCLLQLQSSLIWLPKVLSGIVH